MLISQITSAVLPTKCTFEQSVGQTLCPFRANALLYHLRLQEHAVPYNNEVTDSLTKSQLARGKRVSTARNVFQRF